MDVDYIQWNQRCKRNRDNLISSVMRFCSTAFLFYHVGSLKTGTI